MKKRNQRFGVYLLAQLLFDIVVIGKACARCYIGHCVYYSESEMHNFFYCFLNLTLSTSEALSNFSTCFSVFFFVFSFNFLSPFT